MRLFLLIVTSILFLQPNPLNGQPYSSDTLQTETKWERFNDENDHTLRIVYDENTFSTMIGKTKQSYGNSAEQASLNFISQHKNLLGTTSPSHSLQKVKENKSQFGGAKFTFRQQYKNIPVLNAGYVISVTEHGRIDYISGHFYGDIKHAVTPKITSHVAKQRVIQDVGTSEFSLDESPYLSMYVDTDKVPEQYTLVYAMDVYLDDQSDAWKMYINAADGSIVKKISLVNRFTAHRQGNTNTLKQKVLPSNSQHTSNQQMSIDGTGKVYKVSPLYGTGPTVETLHRLDDLNPRLLRGEHIEQVDYWDNTDASSSTASFQYDTTNPHFDEVMAYYHSDEFENWMIEDFGMSASQTEIALIRTRFDNPNNNNANAPASTTAAIAIVNYWGETSDSNNPTYEAAVIAHEYMHIVSETYNALDEEIVDTKAMDEAYSDYYGMAYINNFGGVQTSTIAEYLDKPGLPNDKRNLDNSYTMDEFEDIEIDSVGVSSAHDKSVIFSGALWEFRNDPEVDEEVADQLIFESLANLNTKPDYLNGMYALISAAQSGGYSSYVDNIEDIFIDRKIFLPAPENFTHTNPGGSFPNFSWDSAPTADKYYIYRRCDFGYYPSCTSQHALIDSTTSTSYTDFTVTENGPGQEDTYRYSVKAVNNIQLSNRSNTASLDGQPSSFKEIDANIPEEFAITENYPNPFNPSTNIEFELPESADVSIKIYNIVGQRVTTLLNENMEVGFHTARFEADNLASGVYIVRLTANGTSGEQFTSEITMQLIK